MFKTVLQLGVKSEEVLRLEQILNKDGHGLVLDYSFGPKVKAAVISFQKKNGLVADGVVGPKTAEKLAELEKRKYSIKWYRGYIQVVSFKKIDVDRFDILNSKSAFETLPSMHKRLVRKPDLMFNGGLFDTKTGTSLSRFKDEGKLIASGYYSKVGMYLDANRKLSLKQDDKASFEFLGFSPSFLIDRKIVFDNTNLSSSFVTSRHPRTSFAESIDEYHIIMAHGRRSLIGHRGMSIAEMADFCYNELKAINGGNFDGGGSCGLLDKLGRWLNKYLEIRGIDNSICVYLKEE